MDAALDHTCEAVCFHCGLPLPPRVRYRVTIAGVARPMCCAGCAAVAQTIADGGLASYYDARTALPETPRAKNRRSAQFASYDLPALQKSFVQRDGQGLCETSLALEGIRCAACAWLIERQLARLPGVTGVGVNYSTLRMWVRWKDAAIPRSRILSAVADIGYAARPFDAANHSAALASARRTALKRLALAALGMMQVMMFAVPAYLAGDGDLAPDLSQLLRWAGLLITL